MTTSWWLRVTLYIILHLVTDVVYGVRFTAEPSSQVAAHDQPLSLNCQAEDDNSAITYRWTFNGVNVQGNEDLVVYVNGTLLIRRVSDSNVGTYVCFATAGGSTLSSGAATVELAYINPLFSVHPQSQSVILGDRVILSCFIESLPTASVTWTLNDQIVTSGTVTQDSNGTSTLVLDPVMYYDVGTYKCTGTNPLIGVYRYSNEASLLVTGQPVFLSSLKSVSVPIGYQATFVCYFHGNPEPDITWFVHYTEDNGDVTSMEIQNSVKYEVYENGTFIINDVRKEDEAFYTCNVGNSFGEMSVSAELTVTGPATPPVFTFTPSNNTVHEEDSVLFLCTCAGNPEPEVTWQKDGNIVSENGSLSISSVELSDIDWYTCLCDNDVGSVNQSVYLDVYTLPAIVNPVQDVTVKMNSSIILHCATTANPQASVSWDTPRFGSIVRSVNGAELYENGSLYIDSVTLNDSGEYTCSASNIVGSVSTVNSVTVQYTPVITVLPLSQGVVIGARVYLHCQARGVPDPMYSWWKDDEGVVTTTTSRQIFLNNTLVLHAVSKQDEGIYKCLAGNDVGITHGVATITVSVPPSFTTLPRNQTVQVGVNVQLTCQADGDPVPTQRWTIDDRQLVLDDNMNESPDQSVLTITRIRVGQFGKYTCIATNIAGTQSASAWLQPYDVPVFTIIPEDTVVVQSNTLTLQCQGQAIEAPSVTWFRGREGEMTLLVNGGNVAVTSTGILTIQSIEASDEGWYTCRVSNSAGEVTTQVFVDVQGPPKIISTNSPQSAVIQLSVTLTCQSTGDPSPTLQWISPLGNEISESSAYQMIDNTLTIVSANQNDFGDWTCKACNRLGCDMTVVQLITEGMPTIESFNGIGDGLLVTLECIAQGNPTPTVTFTSQGQSVTSALQGHSVQGNRILIETGYLRTEYRCLANNEHGSTFKTISVPAKMEAPSAIYTASGTVTLSWNIPPGQNYLPLTGYSIQKKSGVSVSWQPVQSEGHDLGNERSFKVTGLEVNSEYMFRIAAMNLLGLGEFSDSTPGVTTSSIAPSPPRNVLALQIKDGVVVLMWEASQYLNAPIADVAYEYKVVRPASDDGKTAEEIHAQGLVFFNQTLQVQIEDLAIPVVYTVSVVARNTKLNQSSEPVVISIDMTGSGYTDPQPHSDKIVFGRDQVIATVAGIFGGIVLVIVIVIIVTRLCKKKKSKSLSLLDQRLSLDQFYMENPKTLYNDDKYSSKRKSGHSFYSFDESFQSTIGSKGRHNGSVEFLGSSPCGDVLLVSKNPLNRDTELQHSVSHASSRDQLYNESIKETSCMHSDIEVPECDVSCEQERLKGDLIVTGLTREADGNSDKKSTIYNGHNNNKIPVTQIDNVISENRHNRVSNSHFDNVRPEPNVKHISARKPSDHPHRKLGHAGTSNPGQSEQHTRVVYPGEQEISIDTASNKQLTNETASIKPFIYKTDRVSPDYRCTRSASPTPLINGSDSNQPKPPVRVLSLDLLSPSVKMCNEKNKELKLLSENMVKRNNDLNRRYQKDVGNLNDRKTNMSAKNSAAYVNNPVTVNGNHGNNKYSDGNSGPLLSNTHYDTFNDLGRKDLKSAGKDQQMTLSHGTKGDNCLDTIEETYAGNGQYKVQPKPKNVQDDNFLTEAEIKKEMVSAVLY